MKPIRRDGIHPIAYEHGQIFIRIRLLHRRRRAKNSLLRNLLFYPHLPINLLIAHLHRAERKPTNIQEELNKQAHPVIPLAVPCKDKFHRFFDDFIFLPRRLQLEKPVILRNRHNALCNKCHNLGEGQGNDQLPWPSLQLCMPVFPVLLPPTLEDTLVLIPNLVVLRDLLLRRSKAVVHVSEQSAMFRRISFL